MDSKNAVKNKPLNNSEKAKNEFLQVLETQHKKEFAVIDYDAVLGYVHKNRLDNINPGTLLLEEFVQFDDTGYCNTRLLNLGHFTPLFPSVPIVLEYESSHPEYTPTKFLPITFIIRGAKILREKFKNLPWNKYLDQFDNICYHLSNQLSAKLSQTTTFTPAQVVLKNTNFNLEDTKNVKLNIQDESFAHSVDENEDYVVFINCTYNFALDYLAEANLRIQCTHNFNLSDGLYGRFILGGRHHISYQGPTSPCTFPDIFDTFLKTSVLYECPATYVLVNSFNSDKRDNIFSNKKHKQIKEIYHQLRLCYKKNKKFSQSVSASDQFGALGAAIAGVNSISPQFVASYRDIVIDDISTKTRWIPNISQLIEFNRTIGDEINGAEEDVDQTINDKENGTNNEMTALKEYLNLLPLELNAVLNYSHGIFHTNYFKNNFELQQEDQNEKDKIQGSYSNRSAQSIGRDSLDIKNIRLKPINSMYMWDDANLSPLETILFNFCGNIYLFKRFLVMNCLFFITSETEDWWQVQGYDTLPIPTDIKIAGSAIQFSVNPTYGCSSCGSVFYQNKKYCLCFLVIKVLAKLNNCLNLGTNNSIPVPLLKRLYDVYFAKKTTKFNQLVYKGQHTSYKNSMTVIVHELNSNLSYFGDARLKNEGNDKGFCVRRKLYDKTKFNNTKESTHRLSMNNDASNTTSSHNINDQIPVEDPSDTSDPVIGNTMLDNKLKEDINMNDFASTRKLSVMVDDVRRCLKEHASMIDPRYHLHIENPKSHLIHNYTKLWIDPGMTSKGFSYLSGCVVLNTSEIIKVALGKYNNEIQNMGIEEHFYYNKGVKNKLMNQKHSKPKGGINIDDVFNNTGYDENTCDYNIGMSPPSCKKPRYMRNQSIRTSRFIESCLAATLYDDFPPKTKMNSKYYEIIEKISKQQNRGVNTLIQSYIDMISGSGKNLLWHTTNLIVSRFVTLIDDINVVLSRVLCMTTNTLEESWKNFVLTKNKISKDAYVVFDPWFGNSLHRRITYLILFGTIKHQADVKRKTVADNVEVQTTIMEKGCLMGTKIKKEIDLHQIIFDDENQMCKITDQPQKESKTPLDAFLPTRIKIKLQSHPFQNDKKPSFSSSTFYWMGQSHSYGDMEDDVEDEDEDKEEDEDDEERFIPKSILRTDGSNAVKSSHELYTIIRHKSCKISKLSSGTMTNTSSFKSTVNYLIEYFTNRTNCSNLTNTYPYLIIRLFSLLAQTRTKFNNIYTQIFANLDLENLVTVDHRKAVENCVATTGKEIMQLYLKQCTKEDFTTVMGLYLFVLFAELYSPNFYIKTTYEQLDTDHILLNTIIAGCLHLFLGLDDCNKLIKKDNVKQQQLVPNVFWYPFTVNDKGMTKSVFDIKNTCGYYAQFDCTWNSFITQHSPDVFTNLKSSYMIRNSCLTTIQRIPPSYEQNDIICLPLMKVKQPKIYTKTLCLEEVMNTMPFMDMVKYLYDHWQVYGEEIMSLYCSSFNQEILPDTKNDFLQHCFSKHEDNISEEEKLYFQQLLFEEKIYNSINTIKNENNTTLSNIYDVWSDEEDEDEEEEEDDDDNYK